MDATTFEQLVIAVLDDLPPEFAHYLDNCAVIVAQKPSAQQRRSFGLKPWQTLYGCYEGIPLTERSVQGVQMPDTIFIFQAPLTRDFPLLPALREQVRRTVLHEIAHVFGISDERLRELGAY